MFVSFIYVKRKFKSNILEGLISQLPPRANFSIDDETTDGQIFKNTGNDDNDEMGAPNCGQTSFVFDDVPPNPITQEGNTETMADDDYSNENYSKPVEYQQFGRDN